MSSLKFRQFTKAHNLKGLGRPLFDRFFTQFQQQLSGKGISLPADSLDDDEYYKSIAAMLMTPDGLPDDLVEALHAIDEMANEHGQERLEKAIKERQLDLQFAPESSHLEIALQVWIADSDLLTRSHNEHQLLRLSSFEYYGAPESAKKAAVFKEPSWAVLDEVARTFDVWFEDHNRGKGTVRIKPYALNDEHWFMIYHGDTYARTPKIENRRTKVIHYRPEKCDVVVYSPQLNELRINANTKGEKQLYRDKFGFCLFGSEAHFSDKNTYTLEPLRTDGPNALAVHDVEGVKEIKLREIEIFWGGPYSATTIQRADDLFANAVNRSTKPPIHDKGKLMKASFEVVFADSDKPRKVQLRVPNRLKLGRHCDAHLVNRWLSLRGFRTTSLDKE